MSLTRESVAKPMCMDPDSSPDRPPFQRSGAVAPCRRAGTFRENHPAPNTLRHSTGLRCMIRFGNLAAGVPVLLYPSAFLCASLYEDATLGVGLVEPGCRN